MNDIHDQILYTKLIHKFYTQNYKYTKFIFLTKYVFCMLSNTVDKHLLTPANRTVYMI